MQDLAEEYNKKALQYQERIAEIVSGYKIN